MTLQTGGLLTFFAQIQQQKQSVLFQIIFSSLSTQRFNLQPSKCVFVPKGVENV